MARVGGIQAGEPATPGHFTPGMKRAAIVASGLIVIILMLFYDSAASMVRVWANSRTFGHGFLIPPIVAYLIWLRRNALTELDPKPSLVGLVWMMGAALVWLVGQLAHANLLQHLGLIGLIQGVVLATLGLEISRRLIFPLGYMLFMVPFGEFAIKPLQGFTAEHTTTLVRWSGIPVLLENWIITIPGGSFLVAEACAGVRFLIASIALGVLIAGQFFEKWWKRLFFVALSIAVPIGANVVRAYGIVMIAHWSNFELAVGVDHLIYGFIFLSFVMAVLISIAYLMRDPVGGEGRDDHTDECDRMVSRAAPVSVLRLSVVSLLVLTIAGAARAYDARVSSPLDVEIADLRAPAVGRDWRRVSIPPTDTTWHGRYPHADAEGLWRFRSASGGDLSLYVAYYADEGRNKELISSANRLTPSDRVDVIRAGRLRDWTAGGLPPPAFRILNGPGGQRIVWFWYCVDGEVVADPLKAKLLMLRKRLLGSAVPSAVVAVSSRADSPLDTQLVEQFLGASDLVQSMQQQGLPRLVGRDGGRATTAGSS